MNCTNHFICDCLKEKMERLEQEKARLLKHIKSALDGSNPECTHCEAKNIILKKALEE